MTENIHICRYTNATRIIQHPCNQLVAVDSNICEARLHEVEIINGVSETRSLGNQRERAGPSLQAPVHQDSKQHLSL